MPREGETLWFYRIDRRQIGRHRLGNLGNFCQPRHPIHDRPYPLARRRITYLLRRALGDLFFGPYSA